MTSLNKRIHIYAHLMPYNLKIALAFYPEETINDIQFFIEETMKKYRSKYRVGRIEKKQNSSWLLPQYKINEFLEEGDEITVYTCDYGLTKTKLQSGTQIEDIDIGFIGKKSKRKQGEDDSKSKDSNSGIMKKKTNFQNEGSNKKNNQSAQKEGKEKMKKQDESENEDDEENEENKSDNEDQEDDKEESEEDDDNKEEENEEVSSDSGDDKEDDLNLN